MKTYNKTHCPDVINYNGNDYKRDRDATDKYHSGKKLPHSYHIKVNVLSNNLKGRTDLHGKPYQATVFIYSNEMGFMPTVTKDCRPAAIKELNRIQKYGYGV